MISKFSENSRISLIIDTRSLPKDDAKARQTALSNVKLVVLRILLSFSQKSNLSWSYDIIDIFGYNRYNINSYNNNNNNINTGISSILDSEFLSFEYKNFEKFERDLEFSADMTRFSEEKDKKISNLESLIQSMSLACTNNGWMDSVNSCDKNKFIFTISGCPYNESDIMSYCGSQSGSTFREVCRILSQSFSTNSHLGKRLRDNGISWVFVDTSVPTYNGPEICEYFSELIANLEGNIVRATHLIVSSEVIDFRTLHTFTDNNQYKRTYGIGSEYSIDNGYLERMTCKFNTPKNNQGHFPPENIYRHLDCAIHPLFDNFVEHNVDAIQSLISSSCSIKLAVPSSTSSLSSSVSPSSSLTAFSRSKSCFNFKFICRFNYKYDSAWPILKNKNILINLYTNLVANRTKKRGTSDRSSPKRKKEEVAIANFISPSVAILTSPGKQSWHPLETSCHDISLPKLEEIKKNKKSKNDFYINLLNKKSSDKSISKDFQWRTDIAEKEHDLNFRREKLLSMINESAHADENGSHASNSNDVNDVNDNFTITKEFLLLKLKDFYNSSFKAPELETVWMKLPERVNECLFELEKIEPDKSRKLVLKFLKNKLIQDAKRIIDVYIQEWPLSLDPSQLIERDNKQLLKCQLQIVLRLLSIQIQSEVNSTKAVLDDIQRKEIRRLMDSLSLLMKGKLAKFIDELLEVFSSSLEHIILEFGDDHLATFEDDLFVDMREFSNDSFFGKVSNTSSDNATTTVTTTTTSSASAVTSTSTSISTSSSASTSTSSFSIPSSTSSSFALSLSSQSNKGVKESESMSSVPHRSFGTLLTRRNSTNSNLSQSRRIVVQKRSSMNVNSNLSNSFHSSDSNQGHSVGSFDDLLWNRSSNSVSSPPVQDGRGRAGSLLSKRKSESFLELRKKTKVSMFDLEHGKSQDRIVSATLLNSLSNDGFGVTVDDRGQSKGLGDTLVLDTPKRAKERPGKLVTVPDTPVDEYLKENSKDFEPQSFKSSFEIPRLSPLSSSFGSFASSKSLLDSPGGQPLEEITDFLENTDKTITLTPLSSKMPLDLDLSTTVKGRRLHFTK